MARNSTDVTLRFKTQKGLNIHVHFGDITKRYADAIVVPESYAFQNLGMVGKEMVMVQPKFKEKRDKLISKLDLHNAQWKAFSSKLGGSFKCVLHAVLGPVDKCESAEDWRQSMDLLYNNVFKLAEEERIKCLVMPLLDSGNGGVNTEDAINVALDAIIPFKPKHLKWIIIVSQQKGIFDGIVAQCERRLSSVRPGGPTEPRSSPVTRAKQQVKVGQLNRDHITSREVREDHGRGNCMFVSLSRQLKRVFQVDIGHSELRAKLVQYLRDNPHQPDNTSYSEFLTEDKSWEVYLQKMSRDGEWGDNLMLQAAAELYTVEIVVNEVKSVQISIKPNRPWAHQLLLRFRDGRHYESVE